MSIKTRIQKFLVYSIYPQRYTATVSGKMLRGNFKIQSTLFENISKQVQARSFIVTLKCIHYLPLENDLLLAAT